MERKIAETISNELSKIDTTLNLDFKIDTAAIQKAYADAYEKAAKISAAAFTDTAGNKAGVSAGNLMNNRAAETAETKKSNIFSQIKSLDTTIQYVYDSSSKKLDWPELGLQYKTA